MQSRVSCVSLLVTTWKEKEIIMPVWNINHKLDNINCITNIHTEIHNNYLYRYIRQGLLYCLTCKMVKFSKTLFIMYFSGKCLSLWIKLIMYSHIGERWIRYTHFPPSTLAYSVCQMYIQWSILYRREQFYCHYCPGKRNIKLGIYGGIKVRVFFWVFFDTVTPTRQNQSV